MDSLMDSVRYLRASLSLRERQTSAPETSIKPAVRLVAFGRARGLAAARSLAATVLARDTTRQP